MYGHRPQPAQLMMQHHSQYQSRHTSLSMYFQQKQASNSRLCFVPSLFLFSSLGLIRTDFVNNVKLCWENRFPKNMKRWSRKWIKSLSHLYQIFRIIQKVFPETDKQVEAKMDARAQISLPLSAFPSQLTDRSERILLIMQPISLQSYSAKNTCLKILTILEYEYLL